MMRVHRSAAASALTAVLAACALLLTPGARAADKSETSYPERPVTIVMPFAAGGMGDTLARLLAQHLSAEWKQPVMVDNRAGASGMIGNQYVARSKPDGYTLLVGITQLVQAPWLYSKLQYDVQKDFTPLVRLADVLSVFATTDPQIHSLQDYVNLSKQQPNRFSNGSFGAGTSSDIYAQIFNRNNHIVSTHVPYKGAAPMLTDMLGGSVTVAFTDLATALPYIRSGKVRVYAVNGPKRSATLPDVPTFKEQGYAGLDVIGWYGTFAPSGTPNEVVDKIKASLNRVVRLPEVQAKLAEYGLEPVSGPPEDFGQRVKSDLAFWKRVISENNIKIEK